MSTSKFLLGVLGAAAAGVAIGLLLAPEEGSKMRGRLKRTATGWADSIANLFSEAKGQIEEVKGKVHQSRATAEEKVNKLKQNFS